MDNEIFPENKSTVGIEVWVRIAGDTLMTQLATMEVDVDEEVPESEEEEASSRYWARKIYDELADEFGFGDEVVGYEDGGSTFSIRANAR